ncbi:MAG TPA: beta-1,3-glucanase family protein [Chitinivibrionales bacterium]|nr:beta-1,3-glucanase family protein [Chitinivibrionales bacterium]
MRKALGVLMVAFFAGSVFSQTTVSLCGTITDQTGKPIVNAVVRLGQTTFDSGFGPAPYMTLTDQSGHYQLGDGQCKVNTIPASNIVRGDAFSRPIFSNGKVLFSVPQGNAWVKLDLYDLGGRFVKTIVNGLQSKGNYAVSIDMRGISSQFFLLRATINGHSSVLRLNPVSRNSSVAAVRNSPGFTARLEKLAAVVDTIHATMTGYSIGVLPIQSLTGPNDFTLTRNTTWNGDTVAFWGSGFPVATGGVTYVVLNRTNGAWADSQIYWSIQQNGTKTRLDKQQSVTVTGGGRFYIWIDPNDSNSRYFDFVEYAVGNGSINGNNTTRVDGWRLPLAYRIHTASRNYDRGDVYEMFYQSRQAKFDEYKNEVPKEFTGMATQNFANIYAPHMTATNYFNTGGVYATYFDKYQDTCIAHGVGGPPAKTTPFNIFACAGPLSNSATWGGNYNRRVGALPQAQWCDSTKFYRGYPCSYYSKWCHRRAQNNLQYGFPYDDDCNQSGIVGGVSGVQWFEIAIGW